MIKRLSHTGIQVLDQERARRFYTEVLGFEVHTDETMDGFRWLTVSPKEQPDLEIVLAEPAPPMFSQDDAATVRALTSGTFLTLGLDQFRAVLHRIPGLEARLLQRYALPAEV